MNHQGLIWNVHCVWTVVLRKELNFKSTVIRSKKIFLLGFEQPDPCRTTCIVIFLYRQLSVQSFLNKFVVHVSTLNKDTRKVIELFLLGVM